MKAQLSNFVRRSVIRVLHRFNPGDITIKHHWTGDPLFLHSFRHKDYWVHGKRREHETMQFIARIVRPGDIAVDVGAHIGYIGLYLTKLVGPQGHVYCFEPGSNNHPYTAKNLGTHPNTTVFQKGVGDSCGQLEFVIENLSGQNNSFLKNYECLDLLQKSQGLRAESQVQLIDVVTLDSLMDDVGRIDFVKVDAEGFEWPVLKGAQRLLATQSPAITLEMQFDRQEQFENVASHGYRLFSPGLREIKTFAEFSANIENIFGLHRDRHAALLSELT